MTARGVHHLLIVKRRRKMVASKIAVIFIPIIFIQSIFLILFHLLIVKRRRKMVASKMAVSIRQTILPACWNMFF